jgi:hypothetical protein
MPLRTDCAVSIQPPTPRQRNPESEAAKLGSHPSPPFNFHRQLAELSAFRGSALAPRRVCKDSIRLRCSVCRLAGRPARFVEAVSRLLNISYRPLLPTRFSAKFLPIRTMVGRGGGDRTIKPIANT